MYTHANANDTHITHAYSHTQVPNSGARAKYTGLKMKVQVTVLVAALGLSQGKDGGQVASM